jgi:acetyltransferase
VVPTCEAATPEQAGAIAARLGESVALKILSPDITHKSDVGGVALNLTSEESVKTTARAMRERIRESMPEAAISGFTVQPMVHRPNARELIVGASDDVQFGPVILFGHGGTAVEVIQDKAIALPPLNMRLARDVMMRTRVYRLLEGYRGKPAADLDSIALTLVKVSQLISDIADIAELDINPLLADEQGVVAWTPASRSSNRICPLPNDWRFVPIPKNSRRCLLFPMARRSCFAPYGRRTNRRCKRFSPGFPWMRSVYGFCMP